MRFGLITFPSSRQETVAHAELARDTGFDLLATGDHLRHPRDPALPLLDGWSVLAAWAMAPGTFRIGMLVANMIYRRPTVLAKQAVTVDQLSDGRLDLGLGAGVYPTDHAMAGVDEWSAGERVDRVAEFVRAVDAALRGGTSFKGGSYRFDGSSVAPGPVQQPRPPLTLGAVGPRMLRLAVELADTWSAFGGIDTGDEATFLDAIERQATTVDECCDAAGRDPRSLGRSLLAFRPLRPWASADGLERLVERAARLGFGEIVCYLPDDDAERRVFDVVVADRLAELRTA